MSAHIAERMEKSLGALIQGRRYVHVLSLLTSSEHDSLTVKAFAWHAAGSGLNLGDGGLFRQSSVLLS